MFQTLKDFDSTGKRTLIRLDLNVPIVDGEVTDTTRIDRVKPTLDYLVNAGAKIIVLSHLGRPKGQKNQDFSLSFLPEILQKCWGHSVSFAEDCIGSTVEDAITKMQDGEILLLENIRFYPGEEANDPDFVRSLAKLGDIYVNDAFSVSHRSHASVDGLAQTLPCAAGFLMEQELNALQNTLENPQKPVAAIVGGSKISTKLSVLHNVIEKVDYLILGGAMANTFLCAQGHSIGKSMCETDMKDEANAILEKALQNDCQIVLPIDVVTVEVLEKNAEYEIDPIDAIPDNQRAVDIGPASIENLQNILLKCKTLLWNGPLGVFEVKPFDNGTNKIAQFAAELTRAKKLLSVAGGGDTASAMENAGTLQDFSYVSSAGGAFLEWLEGKTLPGVKALQKDQQEAA